MQQESSAILALYSELSKLARLYQTRDRAETLSHGLSVSQTNALFILTEEGSSTIGPLAKALGLSLSALTKIVTELETKGLLQRRDLEGDRRACVLQVTAKGARIHQKIKRRFLQHLETSFQGQSVAEIASLSKGLETLTKTVLLWQSQQRVTKR